jgi:hypothetical protein
LKLKKVVIQIPKAETKTKSRDKSEATQLIMSTEKSPFSPVAMRSVAWFYQRLGKPVSVTHADMQSVYGDAAPDMSTVWRWYQLHAGDNIDLGTNRGLAGQETKVWVSVWSVFSMMNHMQPYGKLLWLLERQSRQFGAFSTGASFSASIWDGFHMTSLWLKNRRGLQRPASSWNL